MKAIIICSALYLIWVVCYLCWAHRKSKKSTIQKTIIQPSKSGDIMGQTKTANRQITPTTANQRHDDNPVKESVTFALQSPERHSKVVGNDEFEDVFSDNKMEIDVDADYLQNEIEQEEISCFSGAEPEVNISGVGYDEMDNLTKVIGEKENRTEKIAQAAKTARKVENTELLDAVMAGYENGLEKVAAMLAKYETMQQTAIPKMERFEEFELNNFL